MAATGARVMMARSIEIARRYGVPLHVRSAFGDSEGTWIVEEAEPGAREGDHLRRHARHLRGEGDGPRRARPPRHRRARVPRARRRRREHRHDRPERLGRRRRPTSRSRCRRPTSPAAEPILEQRRRRDRREGRRLRRGGREGLARRGGHEEPSRRRRRHVRGARGGRHQHRDHLHVVDPRLVRRARRPRSRRAVQAVHEKFRLFAEERVDA